MTRNALTALEGVDWDFIGSTTDPLSVHALHWFPGNFLPQIPQYLIEALSAPGDRVLDPFAGSGTSGIEALRLGRRVVQFDLSSASVQVMRGKLALLSIPAAAELLRDVLEHLTWDYAIGSRSPGAAGEGMAPELSAWFSGPTLHQLRGLWKIVEDRNLAEIRFGLELLFTDTLFACASTSGARTSSGRRRRHHWGWIADNVLPQPPKEHNAVAAFREKVLRAIDVVGSSPTLDADRSIIARGDARRLPLADDTIDLIVTSPPYINMIDYTMANRLTYTWMNWSTDAERTAEIGARFKRRRRSALEDYRIQLRRAWSEMRRVLRHGGRLGLVVGSSRTHPNVARDVLEELGDILKPAAGPFPRTPTRRRVSEREGTAPTEFVAVYQK